MRYEESAAAACPVLFVVDADPEACTRTESALTRRFGPDYSVRSADSRRWRGTSTPVCS